MIDCVVGAHMPPNVLNEIQFVELEISRNLGSKMLD